MATCHRCPISMTFLAVLAAMAQGCHHSAPPQVPVASAPEVTAAKPQRQPLVLATTQPGRIEPFEQTPLFAKVAGYVDSVAVDIGDVVKKGDVLVRLSVPELADELHQKEALVAQAEAEAQQAESLITASRAAAETAKSRIAEADAGLIRARADVERWKSEHDRIEELASKGSVTQKLAEETLNALRSAEAAVQEAVARGFSARTSVHEAQARIGTAEADKAAAEARHKVALAAVGRAKTMITYTEIRAPFDGMVTRRTVDTGHFVQPVSGPSSTPLLEVARIDTVRIFVDVPELEAVAVDSGDPATIRVQAIAADPIKATVTRTSGTLLESNHSLRVEIDVPNPEGLLKPGMYAAVTLELDKVPECIVIPVTAVVRDGANTLCCVVNEGKIERRPIELGLRSGPLVEARVGLNEDSLVVIKQPELLREGQLVRIATAP